MKVTEAIELANELIEAALVQAGLVKGQYKQEQEIAAEQRVMFWEFSVTSKTASEKETYVTYEIYETEPVIYYDGMDPIRKAKAVIGIYSRSRNTRETQTAINTSFLENGWTFELDSRGYDFSGQLFYHNYVVERMLDNTTDQE
jgi:hypothetical protein